MDVRHHVYLPFFQNPQASGGGLSGGMEAEVVADVVRLRDGRSFRRRFQTAAHHLPGRNPHRVRRDRPLVPPVPPPAVSASLQALCPTQTKLFRTWVSTC